MVVVRIIGGLGNQLFQYAAAKATAARLNAPLLLDTSRFRSERERDFLLPRFHIDTPQAGRLRTAGFRSFRVLNRLGLRTVTFYKERSLHHDDAFLRLNGHLYLSGYFQREEYFEPVADALRRELVLREEPDSMRRLSERLRQGPSVCLHVRRGDYFARASTRSVFGVCTPAYYRRCVTRLRERHEGLRFFVFSDDLAWAQQHVVDDPAAFELVDDHGAQAPQHDLVLLSRGRHLVLSNSSFSWWAGWLNDGAGDVLVPTRWNNTPSLGSPSVRAGWVAVDPDDADEAA